ncbi:RHS repeat-associated core domain-containing protein, partial [Pasteurellaceae bacterium LIM206]|nr:RHS repeat-associated core domain-containing protein [Pasteurellaceae bacterium LIM206]
HYAANDSAPLSCNHRFVGQYYDEESGLHYNRFRYYSPETGQYISSDPIGLLGGFNPYGYVGIPTAFVDPLGLAVCNRPGGYETGDVDSHGSLSPQANRAPGHTNTSADGFIQSHHPIQDAWARQHIEGYSRNQAPATLLPSTSGEPHAQISAAQRARRAQPSGWNTTLRDEFNIGYREMIDAGVPRTQAQKAFKDAYKYFDSLRADNINNPFFNI